MQYIYELKDDSNKYLIKSAIIPEKMKELVFYIQYKYKSIISQDKLTNYDIETILQNCYDEEKVINVKADEIIDINLKLNKDIEKSIIANSWKYEVNGLTNEFR